MNQVYISGFIIGKPVFRMEKENTPHMILTLDVQHKNSAGKVQHEHYTINAWNNIANWGMGNLEDGQMVMIRGYLTQRAQFNDDKMMIATEVTAEEFMPARQLFKRKNADDMKLPIPEKEQEV